MDALRLRFDVDSLIPHRSWNRRPGSSWSLLDLGSGVTVFARVQQSTSIELARGAAHWSLALECKDFASKLGCGPFDSVPAVSCVSVMESGFDYLKQFGMLETADLFTGGRVNRVDVTVDLDPGSIDVGAFLHVFADSFPLHKSRRFSDRGVTGVSIDGVRHERCTFYDKQRLRTDQGFAGEPSRLRVEFNYLTHFLRQFSLKGPSDMSDQLCTDLFSLGVGHFGLQRDWRCRDQLWAQARAAGIPERTTVGLVGYLDALQRGITFSAPTRRKYDRLADQLGVRGLLDGVVGEVQSYSIDWDRQLLSMSATRDGVLGLGRQSGDATFLKA
jgi:hypothetical protein